MATAEVMFIGNSTITIMSLSRRLSVLIFSCLISACTTTTKLPPPLYVEKHVEFEANPEVTTQPARALTACQQDVPAAPQVAAPTRRYLALSLVGDRLWQISGVGAAGTGSILRGRATTTSESQPDAPHDRLAVASLVKALRRAEPTAAVACLSSSAASDFSNQDDWFVGDHLELPDTLRKAVVAEHAQRLILVTKESGPARVSDGHFSEGPASGHFEGLGLYHDSNQMMADKTHGFLAPFVYVKVSLVDVNTFAVLGSRDIQSTHPMRLNWAAATDEISRLLATGIFETTPKLIAAAQMPG